MGAAIPLIGRFFWASREAGDVLGAPPDRV
jgi:hypothetical protein